MCVQNMPFDGCFGRKCDKVDKSVDAMVTKALTLFLLCIIIRVDIENNQRKVAYDYGVCTIT